MEETLRIIAAYTALALELTVVIVVAYGAAEAIITVIARLFTQAPGTWSRRTVWLRFATWILLALEFALGADIIRTAIAPTWDDVGKLAAIAAIRTGLSFFLSRDIEEMGVPAARKAEEL